MEIIVPERGTHFDPYLIDLFVETSETFRRIYGELSDS
jgi:response regulator RpfG family c-di-GMP phosphodiesterase